MLNEKFKNAQDELIRTLAEINMTNSDFEEAQESLIRIFEKERAERIKKRQPLYMFTNDVPDEVRERIVNFAINGYGLG